MFSTIRKLIFLFQLCLVAYLLAGCELVDLVKRIVRDIYGSPSEISVMVYPPFPTNDSPSTQELRKTFSNAENVKRGLMDGVDEFNEASSGTTIIPIYGTKSGMVIDFYDQILDAISSGRQDDIKKICFRQIRSIRENSEFHNTSCIIFGLFQNNPNATHFNVQLYYYDYAKNYFATKHGVVDKSDSRAREADLQNLMKALLKKVYD